jgi:cell division septal protein FtsQ
MVTEPTPASGDEVPDAVLEELLSAFSDAPAAPSPASPAPEASTPPVDQRSSRERKRDERAAKKASSTAAKEAEQAARHAAKDAEKASRAAAKAASKAGKKRKDAEASTGIESGERASEDPAASIGASGGSKSSTIVIGADDDLPDLRYLDEVVEGDQSVAARPTIAIGDDLDSTGAFDAISVPNRSMDPRVRARRIAVKRAAGRKRLIWVGVAVAIVLVLVGAFAVLGSSLFAVEQVRVQGAVYTDPVRLQAVVDDLMGEPVLLVDTLAAERDLQAIPWVERAIVTTKFPHEVLIDIRERVPLASFRGSDGRYRVIDRDGRVLDVLDGQPVDYLLVEGQAPDTEPGGYAGAPFAGAAQLVGALPEEIRSITRNASVDASTGDLGLVLEPGVEVRIGSAAGLDSKLARLLQRVRDGLVGIVAIDVSTDEVSITRG